MQIETILILAVSILFSIICLDELAQAIQNRTNPAVGAVTGFLSTILWFILSQIWVPAVTAEMYVSISYLWMALGFAFLVITFLCVGYMLKFSVTPQKESLSITEENQ